MVEIKCYKIEFIHIFTIFIINVIVSFFVNNGSQIKIFVIHSCPKINGSLFCFFSFGIVFMFIQNDEENKIEIAFI